MSTTATTVFTAESEPTGTLEQVGAVTPPASLEFDPVALKKKYLDERDKRLASGKGVEQYTLIEGSLAHYIDDPYIDTKFTRDPIDEEVEVFIIGGGYGGQLVAVRLLEAGVKNIRIIEKAGDFGGTWYWNRYPGAACDIESYIYMPLCEEIGYVPTEKYAKAKELLLHSQAIGKHYGLYDKTLFQTEVKSLHWDEDTALWTAKTNRGDNIKARFAIPAAGPLHRPKLPGLKGIEEFKGHSFHSSRWDYEYTGGDPSGGLTKLKDKRVGIIGTGATAVQIVPHLGEWAKELYVYQRTPSSIDVRNNRPTDDEIKKFASKQGWQKARMDNFNIIVNGGHQDEDLISDGWTDILRMIFVRPKEEGSTVDETDPVKIAANRQLADFRKMESVRARVDNIVKDKGTADSLKPWYNQFCKRPCFHDEYLPTFNLPNVHLVDTRGKGVDAITEKGIIANGEEIELDCIIYATGFELATDWSHRTGMEIYGRNGQTITEKWSGGASTLHGWTSRGFPNCLFVQVVQAALTPNFIHITNEQANHFAYVISECLKRDIKTFEPSAKAEDDWVKTILSLNYLRAEYNKECTPGYYNNEGKESASAGKNATYGAGALGFIAILDKWRAADQLEGLETTKIDEKVATLIAAH